MTGIVARKPWYIEYSLNNILDDHFCTFSTTFAEKEEIPPSDCYDGIKKAVRNAKCVVRNGGGGASKQKRRKFIKVIIWQIGIVFLETGSLLWLLV